MLIIAVAGAFSPTARAQQTIHSYWMADPAIVGDWSNAENWTAGVPSGYTWGYLDNDGTANFQDAAPLYADLYLGSQSGTSGTLNFKGGTLDSAILEVGQAGAGTVNQSGGDLGNITYLLDIGDGSGAQGIYNLSGTGRVAPEFEVVANHGVGTFNQSGGTNAPLVLKLALDSGSTGTYNLSGGTLSPGNSGIMVGGDTSQEGWDGTGSATFHQTGGTCTGLIHVGVNRPGSFQLEDGEVDSRGIQIGYNGNGIFIQNGGSVTSDAIALGAMANSSGSYEMHDGTLATSQIFCGDAMYSGYNASGRFDQTGGSVVVSGAVRLADGSASSGTYSISGGSFEAQDVTVSGGGTLDLAGSSATVQIAHSLTLGYGGVLKAAPGAVIHMSGSTLFDKGADPALVADLDDVKMIFEGGPSVVDTYEVASRDGGGFDHNFAMGTLQIGGDVAGDLKLVDEFDNQPASNGVEALYLDRLIVNSGSTFDLNGIDVYYRTLVDNGGTILLNGGSLLPEPSLVAPILLLLGVRRCRPRRCAKR